MFDQVIVGVDGRQGGHDAIALARRLAAPGAGVTFAHVYSVPTAAGRAGALALPLQLEAAERLVGLESRQSALMAEPSAVYSSSVADGLHKLAGERQADLLVVGSCHRGLLGRAILGDDTSRTLSGAPCAVAIAPSGYAAASPATLRLSRIGVGCDASPESARALEVARMLGSRHEASVRALSVAPTYGDPGQQLATFSADLDLLVMGSHGNGPVGLLVADGASRYLARAARCPLLVLPRSAGDRLAASEPAVQRSVAKVLP